MKVPAAAAAGVTAYLAVLECCMTLGSRTVPQDEEIGMEVERFVVLTILGLVFVLMQARDVTDLSTPRKFEDLLLQVENLSLPGT